MYIGTTYEYIVRTYPSLVNIGKVGFSVLRCLFVAVVPCEINIGTMAAVGS